MSSFLNAEQQALVQEIAAKLGERGETVCVAESTTGGLISAALLWLAGASRYFAGGGVVYTLNSRIVLAGIDPAEIADYRGTTPEMLQSLAGSLRQRLGATWCLAESGIAGPTGGRSGTPPGRSHICVVGPSEASDLIETGSADREANMIEFATRALRLLRDVLNTAG